MANYVELYVHLVWTTFRRSRVIDAEREDEIHRVIGVKCAELKCKLLAFGGTSDHVHVLAQLHPSISVSRLVAEAKGSSSHAAARLPSRRAFRWQTGFGAFTLSANDIPAVERYVLDQKKRHATRRIEHALESTDSSD